MITVRISKQVDIISEQIAWNIIPMLKKSGMYAVLFDYNGKKAGDLVELFETAKKDMEANFADYDKLNFPGRTLDARVALYFVQHWLIHCRQYPDETIRIEEQ
jgi:hypothetical protein